MLSVDPMIAEQALVVLLSHGTSHAVSSSIVQVTWATINAQVRLTLDYQPATQTETGASSALNPVLGQLAERLGWSIDQPDAEEAMQRLIVGMAAHCPRVLIIDDNQGLVELLRRYLGDRACQVNAATSSAEGLRLAFETAPHAIVLDVMMPDMSGWEVLQRLRGDPRTSAVPIVVCSVVSDPELAMALGATCFLAKPIRQEDVLHALDEIGVL
jgi:CheY-like chemotaxis protein